MISEPGLGPSGARRDRHSRAPSRLCFRLVGEPQAEGAVEFHLVLGVGLGQGGGEVAEAVQDGGELVCGQCVRVVIAGMRRMSRSLGQVPQGFFE